MSRAKGRKGRKTPFIIPPAGYVSKWEAAEKIGVNPEGVMKWWSRRELPAPIVATHKNGCLGYWFDGAAIDNYREIYTRHYMLNGDVLPEPPEGTINKIEAAAIVGCHPNAVSEWYSRRELPPPVRAKNPGNCRWGFWYRRDILEAHKDDPTAGRGALRKGWPASGDGVWIEDLKAWRQMAQGSDDAAEADPAKKARLQDKAARHLGLKTKAYVEMEESPRPLPMNTFVRMCSLGYDAHVAPSQVGIYSRGNYDS